VRKRGISESLLEEPNEEVKKADRFTAKNGVDPAYRIYLSQPLT